MAVLVAVSCAVAVATIALNFHYFTDTVAGAALAVGVVLAATFPLDGARFRGWLGAVSPSRLKSTR